MPQAAKLYEKQPIDEINESCGKHGKSRLTGRNCPRRKKKYFNPRPTPKTECTSENIRNTLYIRCRLAAIKLVCDGYYVKLG